MSIDQPGPVRPAMATTGGASQHPSDPPIPAPRTGSGDDVSPARGRGAAAWLAAIPLPAATAALIVGTVLNDLHTTWLVGHEVDDPEPEK